MIKNFIEKLRIKFKKDKKGLDEDVLIHDNRVPVRKPRIKRHGKTQQ